MQFNQGADAKMGGSKITIADIPFFNHLDAGDIMAVSQHLQALSFAAEDMLFYQGDPPNGLFLVTSGSVKTYVYAPGTTKKVVVKLVKAGDYLGEFGLLDGMPRSASAMAEVTECEANSCESGLSALDGNDSRAKQGSYAAARVGGPYAPRR